MAEEPTTADTPVATSWKQAFMATPGPRRWIEAIILFLKGICMGAADIIPGVSGGTIAFISGIYESLVRAIASFDWPFVKQIFTLRWKTALSHVHLRFMCTLYFGVSLAIFSTASLMTWLMDTYPVLTWSVFFGLIGGSILIVFREVKSWSVGRGVLVLAGAGLAWQICGMIPVNTPTELWFLFVCGIIGICAMILPGISGSFMLLVLGKYYYIIGCLKVLIEAGRKALAFDFSGAYALLAGGPGELSVFWALVAFQCGQLFGIVGFCRVLKWLLARWHEATMCVLAGMMIGAMRKIWPWKHTLDMDEVVKVLPGGTIQHKAQPLIEQMVWPWDYAQSFVCKVQVVEGGTVTNTINRTVSDLQPQTAWALVMMVVGFVLVLTIEYTAKLVERERPAAKGLDRDNAA